MSNGQIRPIYQNITTRDEKRYQLFSDQKINLNLKVKNEAEYIIFDYDPNILLLRQPAENSCVPQSPASKAAAEEVCFVGERRREVPGQTSSV